MNSAWLESFVCRVLIVCSSVLLAFTATDARAQQKGMTRDAMCPTSVVRVGFSSWAIPSNNRPIVDATLNVLKERFGEDCLDIRQYSLDGLAEAIKKNEVDFFQSSAGFFRRQYDQNVRALVSAASSRFPDPNNSEGSVIVARADRDDIQTIEDVYQMILSANSSIGFSGYQIPMGEIARIGGNPETYFSKTLFTGEGGAMRGVIENVLSGRADVGFLRLCYLEHFPEAAKKLKVLNSKQVQGESCVRSTELYPTWTISATRGANPEITRQIASVLLSMPAAKDGLYWGIATDMSRVDSLFKALRIGPYEHLRSWTVARVIAQYWPFIMLFIFCVVGICLHAIHVSHLMRQQSVELKNALASQAKLLMRAKDAAARIDELQRIGTIGLLCSMVAHELNQPLGALMLYARGLLRVSEKQTQDKLKLVYEDIAMQSKRAYDIVSKVRGYAKGRGGRVLLNFSQLVEKCVSEYEISGRLQANFLLDIIEGIWVVADVVEMELVVLNLIRNASEALQGQGDGVIHVRVIAEDGCAYLTILDNGKQLTQNDIEKMADPMQTQKTHGLGMGLRIVRSIVESHGGRLTFSLNPPSGLRVVVKLPDSNPPKDNFV